MWLFKPEIADFRLKRPDLRIGAGRWWMDRRRKRWNGIEIHHCVQQVIAFWVRCPKKRHGGGGKRQATERSGKEKAARRRRQARGDEREAARRRGQPKGGVRALLRRCNVDSVVNQGEENMSSFPLRNL